MGEQLQRLPVSLLGAPARAAIWSPLPDRFRPDSLRTLVLRCVMDDGSRIKKIHEVLRKTIPDTSSLLDYRNPFELLIAVILSAQTTDAQVNLVTPILFGSYPDAASLADAPLGQLERIVKSTGFYKSKARNIKRTAERLVSEHHGEVPRTMSELLELPGVGRKSANVVRGVCYGDPGIIVDTHFGRVARRLGLTTETDPAKVESEVAARVPEALQLDLSMRVNRLGRMWCTARKPDCDECPVRRLCPSAGSFGDGASDRAHQDLADKVGSAKHVSDG